MDEIDSITPKDRAILQDLWKQEQIGEDAFSLYYQGDSSGASQINAALQQSLNDICKIHNSALHRRAKELLNVLNQTLKQYLKNPSDKKLETLKSNIDDYKDFLTQYRV